MKKSVKQSFVKVLFILVCLLTTACFSSAQIKVDSDGNVGLHTTSTSTSGNVYVYGDMQMASSTGTYLNIDYTYAVPFITPGTATTGYLGTSSLPFQYLYCYYVKGYALHHLHNPSCIG